jgi:hypothetical protein
MKTRHSILITAAVVAASGVCFPAVAQERVDTVEYTGPDRGLLSSGAWTLGLSYAPALIVGIGSSLPADRYLLAPVAGPWVDFAKRDCPTCEHETLNRVLLATDGVIQGVGALEIIGSLFFVEHSVTTRPARREAPKTALHLHVVPSRFAGGYGLTAIGNF